MLINKDIITPLAQWDGELDGTDKVISFREACFTVMSGTNQWRNTVAINFNGDLPYKLTERLRTRASVYQITTFPAWVVEDPSPGVTETQSDTPLAQPVELFIPTVESDSQPSTPSRPNPSSGETPKIKSAEIHHAVMKSQSD